MNTQIALPEEKQLMEQIESHADGPLTLPALKASLLDLKAIAKRVEARKQEITAPMREALASARALFKPLEEAIANREMGIKIHLLRVEAIREKEEAKTTKKVEKGLVDFEDVEDLMGGQESGLFRTIKKMVIKNKKLIPDKYWVIDEVALRADLIAGKKVPGAELKDEKIVSAR